MGRGFLPYALGAVMPMSTLPLK